MQEFVFFIDGDVLHPLTIDPTVWIFDERKVDLDTFFDEVKTEEDEITAYTKAISAQWDKEITEGATPPNPNSNQNEIKYEKQKLIHGSFGMPLKPFLVNTRPVDTPQTVEVIQKDGSSQLIPYSEAQFCILGFSDKGQKLAEDGPVHVYLGNGSNRDNPIKDVVRFVIHKSE